MQPAIRIEVTGRDDELLLQSDGTDEIQEEGFSGSILADDQAERRSTFRDPLDISQKRFELA